MSFVEIVAGEPAILWKTQTEVGVKYLHCRLGKDRPYLIHYTTLANFFSYGRYVFEHD